MAKCQLKLHAPSQVGHGRQLFLSLPDSPRMHQQWGVTYQHCSHSQQSQHTIKRLAEKRSGIVAVDNAPKNALICHTVLRCGALSRRTVKRHIHMKLWISHWGPEHSRCFFRQPKHNNLLIKNNITNKWKSTETAHHYVRVIIPNRIHWSSWSDVPGTQVLEVHCRPAVSPAPRAHHVTLAQADPAQARQIQLRPKLSPVTTYTACV